MKNGRFYYFEKRETWDKNDNNRDMGWFDFLRVADSPYYRNILRRRPQTHVNTPIPRERIRLYNYIKNNPNLTMTVYHGTALVYYEQSLKNGYLTSPSLRRDSEGSLMSIRENRKAGLDEVFVTTSPSYALYYANRASSQAKRDPEIPNTDLHLPVLLQLEVPLYYIKEISDVILQTERIPPHGQYDKIDRKDFYNESDYHNALNDIINEHTGQEPSFIVEKILEFILKTYYATSNEFTIKYILPTRFIKKSSVNDAHFIKKIAYDIAKNNTQSYRHDNISILLSLFSNNLKNSNPNEYASINNMSGFGSFEDLLSNISKPVTKVQVNKIKSVYNALSGELKDEFKQIFLNHSYYIFDALPDELKKDKDIRDKYKSAFLADFLRDEKEADTLNYFFDMSYRFKLPEFIYDQDLYPIVKRKIIQEMKRGQLASSDSNYDSGDIHSGLFTQKSSFFSTNPKLWQDKDIHETAVFALFNDLRKSNPYNMASGLIITNKSFDDIEDQSSLHLGKVPSFIMQDKRILSAYKDIIIRANNSNVDAHVLNVRREDYLTDPIVSKIIYSLYNDKTLGKRFMKLALNFMEEGRVAQGLLSLPPELRNLPEVQAAKIESFKAMIQKNPYFMSIDRAMQNIEGSSITETFNKSINKEDLLTMKDEYISTYENNIASIFINGFKSGNIQINNFLGSVQSIILDSASPNFEYENDELQERLSSIKMAWAKEEVRAGLFQALRERAKNRDFIAYDGIQFYIDALYKMRQIGVIDQYINDPGTIEAESHLMLNLIQYKNAWICDNPLPVHLPDHESVDFQNFKSRTFNKNLVSKFVQEWQEKYDKNPNYAVQPILFLTEHVRGNLRNINETFLNDPGFQGIVKQSFLHFYNNPDASLNKYLNTYNEATQSVPFLSQDPDIQKSIQRINYEVDNWFETQSYSNSITTLINRLEPFASKQSFIHEKLLQNNYIEKSYQAMNMNDRSKFIYNCIHNYRSFPWSIIRDVAYKNSYLRIKLRDYIENQLMNMSSSDCNTNVVSNMFYGNAFTDDKELTNISANKFKKYINVWYEGYDFMSSSPILKKQTIMSLPEFIRNDKEVYRTISTKLEQTIKKQLANGNISSVIRYYLPDINIYPPFLLYGPIASMVRGALYHYDYTMTKPVYDFYASMLHQMHQQPMTTAAPPAPISSTPATPATTPNIPNQGVENEVNKEKSAKNKNWYRVATVKVADDYMKYDDLEDKNKVYDVFKDSYEKATGTAWSKDKFVNRAHGWRFYGDQSGYITVREQKSGMLKLTGIAGSMKGIYKGLQELKQEASPLWGMVSNEIATMAEKAGFIRPNSSFVAQNIKKIPSNVFGGASIEGVGPTGGILFRYRDIGVVEKHLICNQAYMSMISMMGV